MDYREYILSGQASEEELVEFAASNDLSVAMAVAESPHTPASILRISALDADKQVRTAVARNHNATEEILLELLADPDPDVVEAAKKRMREAG